jgi:hypothetical protein
VIIREEEVIIAQLTPPPAADNAPAIENESTPTTVPDTLLQTAGNFARRSSSWHSALVWLLDGDSLRNQEELEGSFDAEETPRPYWVRPHRGGRTRSSLVRASSIGYAPRATGSESADR